MERNIVFYNIRYYLSINIRIDWELIEFLEFIFLRNGNRRIEKNYSWILLARIFIFLEETEASNLIILIFSTPISLDAFSQDIPKTFYVYN